MQNIMFSFQFHNGSIKSGGKFALGALKHRFNSTMVRLKDGKVSQKLVDEQQFQFHNGSIKRTDILDALALTALFQFHNGSIKSKVPATKPTPLMKFQFHNGSIKSGKVAVL